MLSLAMNDQTLRLEQALAKLRLQKKVKNQQDLADKLNYNKSHISEVMNGRRPLTKPFLAAMQIKFGISEHWLLTGQGEMFASASSDALEEIGPLPIVTHSQAQKALADKVMQNREKLDKTALEVLAMYVSNPAFLLIGDYGRISVSEADHKTIARNAYSQASEMISESEQWVRVN